MLGSSEEEESGMESGVDTYSRSSSRRGEEREEAREVPAQVKTEEGESLEGKETSENSKKRKKSNNISDPKRLKAQNTNEGFENNAATGESEVENNNRSPGRKSNLLPLQPQPLVPNQSTVKDTVVTKTPGRSAKKEPVPPCIHKKFKRFNGTNTMYYYHACNDYNYEDMRQVDKNLVNLRLGLSEMF